MKSKLFALVILLGVSHSLSAYPISPRPLRKLIIEAKYIAYATVVRIEETKVNDYWNDTKAILAIKEVLQGRIRSDTIEVFFTPFMICPAPAQYREGTSVLAFLRKAKKSDGYTTHALSYGAKTLDDSEYEIYKQRIIEMRHILRMDNNEIQTPRTIDWLLKCAINPVTRWEGVYELSPKSDFMSYYDQDKQTFVLKYRLNGTQKALLREVFFEIDELQYYDLALIDLIVEETDPELLEFLINKVKNTNTEKVWYRKFIFVRIAEVSNRDDLRMIVREMEELDYFDENRDEKENELARAFLEKI